MKTPNRQIIGILLVVGVIICGAAYQGLGPGLIASDNPTTPLEQLAQGIALTERTVYHFALFPLVALGIVGLVLAIVPKRDATAQARS
jgi:hypothetical protein